MNPKLFNADYLRYLTREYGIRPSQKYGQNFLLDFASVEKMIAAAKINGNDTVVEIGPGFGALTFALAERAGKAIAFEIEKKLAPYWAKNKPENVEIIWGNVLYSDFVFDNSCERVMRPQAHPRALAREESEQDLSKIKYKVVANLPYQITSAAIRHFLENENPPESMTIMVQKEVAERICARPGRLSLLAVSVQYYGEPEPVAIVPKNLFWPAPSVDSAIIKITVSKDTIPDRNFDRCFFQVVKAGFASKRKKLSSNLAVLFADRKQLNLIFSRLGIGPNARAQELTVDDWRSIARVIH